jgi:hypothetical protein
MILIDALGNTACLCHPQLLDALQALLQGVAEPIQNSQVSKIVGICIRYLVSRDGATRKAAIETICGLVL